MSESNIVRARVLPDGSIVQVMPDGSLTPIEDRTDWARLDAMTEEEIGVKFTALGRDVLGGGDKGVQRCRELGKMIMAQEKEKDMGALMKGMTA